MDLAPPARKTIGTHFNLIHLRFTTRLWRVRARHEHDARLPNLISRPGQRAQTLNLPTSISYASLKYPLPNFTP
ncbi:hypothetical protein HZ326_2404 [Fusarium oxysporum f. sp. albedinis]|nr:hypothetical protein HZ326_2404 [Fusarium oxysporum f. sp. albedinis]